MFSVSKKIRVIGAASSIKGMPFSSEREMKESMDFFGYLPLAETKIIAFVLEVIFFRISS